MDAQLAARFNAARRVQEIKNLIWRWGDTIKDAHGEQLTSQPLYGGRDWFEVTPKAVLYVVRLDDDSHDPPSGLIKRGIGYDSALVAEIRELEAMICTP